jgi:hypothetical protein
MKRNHWLLAAILVLLVGNIVWHVWGSWGLITIHSENKPLAEIIRSIEKQGGVKVKTDLDLNAPVRMYVDKVKLAEALETLSTLTDSRWRLAYLVGPDKGAIAGALGTFTAGQRVEGWKALSVPVPGVVEEVHLLPDPRTDAWEVKAPQEPKLQAYLQQAARTVSASFIYPNDWNPDVSAPPKSGPIAKTIPRLAKAVQGQYEEVFLLQRRGGGPGDGGGDDGDGPRFAAFDGGRSRTGFDRERGGFDRDAMEERIQAEIKKLPSAERAAALADHAERKKFFEGMRDLTPEQRQAKMEEFMNSEANAERMEKAASARDARRSPQQKMERSKKYLDRKEQVKSGTAPTGGGGGRP